MKKLVNVQEIEGEGLESLLGEEVLLMCCSYFYKGKLIGVNEDFVLLENPYIVYETGEWSKPGFTDAQKLHVKEWYVRTKMIESYGKSK